LPAPPRRSNPFAVAKLAGAFGQILSSRQIAIIELESMDYGKLYTGTMNVCSLFVLFLLSTPRRPSAPRNARLPSPGARRERGR
jgi:hypothetical protein